LCRSSTNLAFQDVNQQLQRVLWSHVELSQH
jgi:hypothetical protein